MAAIKVLSEVVSGRIAAGEVVERPASVVKELLENAIDAGASSIVVAIEEGGIKRIRVTDNGYGIDAQDMPLTIVKHATSKIYTLEDLDNIYTMGFRGEALSSIAAVSMLTIRSKRADAEVGNELKAVGGKNMQLQEAGLPDGTTVLVENLFFNMPARLKFLKKPGTEAAAVSGVVSNLVIAHPGISFKYTSNGNTVYHSPGSGSLLDAIVSVEGPEIKHHLIAVNATFNDMQVSGYTTRPSAAYKRNNGRIYVNTRAIRAEAIADTVLQAYGERLMKGNFPYYVINLTLPAKDVDVNVHPNKLLVHFRDENALKYLVGNAISDALYRHATTPVIDLVASKEQAPSAAEPVFRAEQAPIEGSADAQIADNAMLAEAESRTAEQSMIDAEIRAMMEQAMRQATEPQGGLFLRQFTDISTQKKRQEREAQEVFEQPSVLSKETSYRIIGAVFHSFIAVEAGEAFYLIDQHAAHERLIYDELCGKLRQKLPIQSLLVSGILKVSHQEALVIEENMPYLQNLGIEISPFGTLTYKIDAIPQILEGVSPEALLRDLIEALRERTPQTLLSDRLARAACKRAVKAGAVLPEDALDSLIKTLIESETIPNCPHGRPVAICLTKAQLEKSFKRRV